MPTYPDQGSPGDTIDVPTGSYNVASFKLLDGRSYVGHNATLVGGILDVPGDFKKLSVRGFRFSGAGIRLAQGRRYGSIDISRNEFEKVPAGNPAIKTSVRCDALTTDRNFFHDFDHWGVLNDGGCDAGSMRWNVARYVTQLAHTMGLDDFVSERNVAIGLTRMFIEQQEGNSYAERHQNLTVQDNVAFDWRDAYWESYGLSIMQQSTKNVRVLRNWIRMNKIGGFSRRPPWKAGDPDRWGIGLEIGGDPATLQVEGNAIGCNDPIAYVGTASSDDVTFRGTKIFGFTNVGFSGEPGVKIPGIGDGFGTAKEDGTVRKRFDEMGPPPAWALARLANPMGELPMVDVESGGIGGVSSVSAPTISQQGRSVVITGTAAGTVVEFRTKAAAYTPVPSPWNIPADWYRDTYELWFRARSGSAVSSEVRLQLKPVAVDPTPAPSDTDNLRAQVADLTKQLAAANAENAKLTAGLAKVASGLVIANAGVAEGTK